MMGGSLIAAKSRPAGLKANVKTKVEAAVKTGISARSPTGDATSEKVNSTNGAAGKNGEGEIAITNMKMEVSAGRAAGVVNEETMTSTMNLMTTAGAIDVVMTRMGTRINKIAEINVVVAATSKRTRVSAIVTGI